jgi:hypothetical protein
MDSLKLIWIENFTLMLSKWEVSLEDKRTGSSEILFNLFKMLIVVKLAWNSCTFQIENNAIGSEIKLS